MPDEKEIGPRRRYIQIFRRHLKWCKDSNLSERVSIGTTLARTKIEHKLSNDHRRDVDEFLKKETMVEESRPIAPREELPFYFEVK